jgi:hypothetical protein
MVSRKACPVCTKEFTTPVKHPYKKFCSTKCRMQLRKEEKWTNKICPYCYQEFKSHFKKKYCSSICAKKAHRESEVYKANQKKHNELKKTEEGKARARKYFKEYYQSEKGRKIMRKVNKKYAESDKGKETLKKYYVTDKYRESRLRSLKKYKKTEKGKISERKFANKYTLNRRKADPLYKLITNMRKRTGSFFKSKKMRKHNTTFELIGCTPEFLKEHIEKQFQPGMTWDNNSIDGWHIDHIIPLDSAKNEEDVKRLCHYTNLQPLWAEQNIKKGNKLIYES